MSDGKVWIADNSDELLTSSEIWIVEYRNAYDEYGSYKAIAARLTPEAAKIFCELNERLPGLARGGLWSEEESDEFGTCYYLDIENRGSEYRIRSLSLT